MANKSVIALIGIASAVVACVVAYIFSTGVNTKTAGPMVRAHFPAIGVGQKTEDVYSALGEPLFLEINPDRSGDGSYRGYIDRNMRLEHVRGLLLDTNKRISCVYSEPRVDCLHLHYFLYYVTLTNNVVEQYGGPIEMD